MNENKTETETEFRVMWASGGYTTHPTFEDARQRVRDNIWGTAVKIERIETVWVPDGENGEGEGDG